MKIAVTGAAGHVGCNLIRALLKDGEHKIRVLQYHDHKGLDGLDIEIVEGDLHQPETLVDFCRGIDVLFHLASKISIGSNSYESIYQTNVQGTKNLVQAAQNAGVKKYIHFSSIHALIHEPFDKVMDESRGLATHSFIAYEKTKSLAEEWVLTQKRNDFEVVVLNPTSIIGPADYKPSLMGQLLIRLYNNSLPGLVPGGYDWVDVRDIVKSAISAIKNGKSGESYILSGGWTTVKELAGVLAEENNIRINKPIFPIWLARIGVPFIHIWSKVMGQHPLYTNESLTILQSGNKNISHQKAAKDLGHTARPLAETLKDAIDWFKENNYI